MDGRTEHENSYCRQVWIDQREKIAYFHAVEDCQLEEFYTYLTYDAFLIELVRQGYRFG